MYICNVYNVNDMLCMWCHVHIVFHGPNLPLIYIVYKKRLWKQSLYTVMVNNSTNVQNGQPFLLECTCFDAKMQFSLEQIFLFVIDRWSYWAGNYICKDVGHKDNLNILFNHSNNIYPVAGNQRFYITVNPV